MGNKVVKDLSNEDFKKLIGPKIGGGIQGNVHEFNSDMAVKILKIRDMDEIKTEITNGIYAADNDCGPKIYTYRFIDNNAYIVMEKVNPIKLSSEDEDDVVKLFEKLILSLIHI